MLKILERIGDRVFSHYGLMRRIQNEFFCTESTAKGYVEDMKRFGYLDSKNSGLLTRDEGKFKELNK